MSFRNKAKPCKHRRAITYRRFIADRNPSLAPVSQSVLPETVRKRTVSAVTSLAKSKTSVNGFLKPTQMYSFFKKRKNAWASMSAQWGKVHVPVKPDSCM